jgi:ribosomal protein S18 acetylase RimI-like enzyme
MVGRRDGLGTEALLRDHLSVDIRRLDPADFEAYRALRLRGLAEHPEAFTSSHEEDASKPPAEAQRRLAPESPDLVWGAFVDGTLVGVLGMTPERRARSRHKAHVFGMYVPAEYGRRGIGQALLHHVVAAARAMPHLEQLTLTVTRGNGLASRLYERAGFETFGVEPRAVRMNGAYLDKEHRVLFLDPAASARPVDGRRSDSR